MSGKAYVLVVPAPEERERRKKQVTLFSVKAGTCVEEAPST